MSSPDGEVLPAPLIRAGYALEWAAQANLTKRQAAVFALLIRDTLLSQRTWAWFSQRRLASETLLAGSHASVAMNDLVRLGVAVRVRQSVAWAKTTTPKTCFGIAPDFARSSYRQRSTEKTDSGLFKKTGSGLRRKKEGIKEREIQLPPQSPPVAKEGEEVQHFTEIPVSVSDPPRPPTPAAMSEPVLPSPQTPPPPLPPSVADAWEAWKPAAFNGHSIRELRVLVAEFGERAVCDAIHTAATKTDPITAPFKYLRGVCQGRASVALAVTTEAVGAQLATTHQRQATNRKTVASADAPPEVKQVLLALMDGFGLFSVGEPLPVALHEIDRIITEQAPALDPETEDRTKTAALLAWALTHLPANHYLRGKITRVAAFDRNVSAITATIAQKMATDQQAARVAELAAKDEARARRFEAYKRSILH